MGFEINISNMSCCDWKDKRIAELEAQLAKFDGIKLTKLSYYERNKERLNRENADKRWCCEVCNIEVAGARRAAHCRTKMHLMKVAIKDGNIASADHLRAYTDKEGFCDVCQIPINPRTVWHHEHTAMHQKRLAAQVDEAPQACMPCKV